MFRNLLTRLFAQDAPDQPLAAEDAELAVAALLVRVARADDRYGPAERGRIDHLLARRRPQFGWDREVVGPALRFGAPVAGSNGLGDLTRELRYARERSGIDGLKLVPGTEPFSGSGWSHSLTSIGPFG